MIKLIAPLDQVDTSAVYTLGTTTITKDGNEYIYLSGVASVAAKSWVTFLSTSSGSVTLLATTGGVGRVGIAQAAITNNRWGWFLIGGTGLGLAGNVCSSGSALYSSGTAAQVATGVVAGDLIAGAFSNSANAGGSVSVTLIHPFCTDTLS